MNETFEWKNIKFEWVYSAKQTHATIGIAGATLKITLSPLMFRWEAVIVDPYDNDRVEYRVLGSEYRVLGSTPEHAMQALMDGYFRSLKKRGDSLIAAVRRFRRSK